MNRLTLQIKLYCLAILLFSVFTVSALTLNPLIEAPDGHTLIYQKPLLFNDQIIFVTEQEDDYILWSYDVTDSSYSALQTFDDYFYPNFYVLENTFYFKDGSDLKLIWRSDGTPSGTQQVDMSSLIPTKIYSSPLAKKGNLIFARGSADGNRLIALNNYGVNEYINHFEPKTKAACGFGVFDVIISSQVRGSYQKKLVRYQSNNVIDYSEEFPEDFNTDQDRVWFYEDTCFYHIDGFRISDILVIPEQGAHYFLGEQLGFSQVNFLTRFKDSYYILAEDEDRNGYVVKLSGDLSAVVKQVDFDLFGGVSLIVSEQYLIAYTRTGGGVSPPTWKSGYFDKDLNEVTGLGGPFTDVPEVYQRDDGETVVFNEYVNGINQKIITTDISDKNSGLVLNADSLSSVIVNENATETYALVRELQTGEYDIQKLDAIPDMGSLSVGNWFDPDYQSQGISIVEGLRDDGTRYLFVTLYLFRDGQPLWLAGTSNVIYPQPTMDIELGLYSGLGLWQPDTPAQVEKFADMTLSMSGCHQMMLNFVTVEGQTFSLELQRMVNNDINLYCKD